MEYTHGIVSGIHQWYSSTQGIYPPMEFTHGIVVGLTGFEPKFRVNCTDLKKNLVSISTTEDKGFKVTFSDGKVRIWKNNVKDAFTLGFSVDSLYQVNGSLLGVMYYDTSLQSELWH